MIRRSITSPRRVRPRRSSPTQFSRQPRPTASIVWVLGTHVHDDHLSGAPYIKLKTGAPVQIGEHVREVQKIFRPVFNAADVSGEGAELDRLFVEGERFALGDLEVEVLFVPGHTPADVAYMIGDVVFVSDTMFMPDCGTASAAFPAAMRGLSTGSSSISYLCSGEVPVHVSRLQSARARRLRLGDDSRRIACLQCSCQRWGQRGRIRCDARSKACRAYGAPPPNVVHPGEYERRQFSACR